MSRHDPVIETTGQAARVARAANALVAVLRRDPRARQVYADWRRAHGSGRPQAAMLRQNLAELARFVADDLRLPYRWLAFALLVDFAASTDGRVFELSPPDDLPLPAGRRPKGRGEYIERDVAWYYRAEIQPRREKVRSIARRYTAERRAAGVPLEGVSHSVVQEAIARVKALLSTLDLGGPAI